MDIEQSSLYREVEAIIGNESKPVHYSWAATIHVGDKNYVPLKILSIDFVADYLSAYADEIIVTMAITGGMYSKRIYPFQTDIDITLYRNPLSETGDVDDAETILQTERYTATLLDRGNPLVEGNGMNSPTETALDLTLILEVQFQLVNKAVEKLRMISVGGIYRDVLVEDLLKGILTKESKAIEVDSARLPKGVDMIPASNVKPRDHIIIPQGTLLVHLPEYVQKKCGGVYSSGLGYFLQGDYWYLYPCFDTTRFNTSTNTLTVINIPGNRFSNIERTYRKDGNNLIVLGTGEVHFRDDANMMQLNAGNGVRFADATKFMEGFVQTKDNKAVVSRGANNNEFIAVERPNGNNNVRLSDKAINANPFEETSKLAARQGSVLTFVWENSNPSLLFPGMVAKILYLDGEEIKELYGVVLKNQTFVKTKEQGLISRRHICNTVLSVFVQRLKEDEEVVE